jgi:hypothetical protein
MAAFARIFALAALAACALGCPGRTNRYDVHSSVHVLPVAGVTFNGYTETTLGGTLDPKMQVHILEVTMSSDAGDLTWLKSLQGSARGPDGDTPIFSKSDFGKVSEAQLNVLYDDDVRPFVIGGKTVHVDLSGAYASSLSKAYPNGVEVQLTISVEID